MMTKNNWTALKFLRPKENIIVETKIDDNKGERNIAKLKRFSNGLWFLPDDSMYVYYSPTHWRSIL